MTRNGEPVFDMHAAKVLLKQDVEAGVHLKLSPTELRASRPEYLAFNKVKFKEHIYQEVRLTKYIHYRELKRLGFRKRLAAAKDSKMAAEKESIK